MHAVPVLEKVDTYLSVDEERLDLIVSCHQQNYSDYSGKDQIEPRIPSTLM